MKKILFLGFVMMVALSGCARDNENDVVPNVSEPGVLKMEKATLGQIKERYPELDLQFGTRSSQQDVDGYLLYAPMSGIYKYGLVTVGQKVNVGQLLCVIEAMLMDNLIRSPVDGTIAGVCKRDGEAVENDELLFVIMQ